MARRVVRDALEKGGIAVIAEAGDVRDATDLTLHYRPDVLLIDVGGERDGVEMTRRVCDRAPEVGVMMLSTSGDAELGMKGLRAGASGFMSKDVEPQDLAAHVRRVAAGEPVVAGGLLQRMIDYVRAFPDDGRGMRPVHSPLTSREWEVLDVLSAGYGIEQIAKLFVLSPETVRTHMKAIMRKLQVRSHAEAVRAARRMRMPYASARE